MVVQPDLDPNSQSQEPQLPRPFPLPGAMLPAPTAGARLVRPPPPTAAHRGTAGTRRAAGFAARTRRGSGFDRAWALGVGAARWVRRSRRAKRAKSDLVESEEVEVKKSQSSYSWEKQWYPVLPLSLLQGVGPEPIKLLNKAGV